MSFKGRRPVVFRVLLAFSLVAGLLALEAVPAWASGNVQLSVDMSATVAGHATAGQNYGYTLTVSNSGGDTSSGYTVTIDVPSGTTVGSADPGCTDNAPTPTIDCISAGGLLAGSSDTYSIILNIDPSVADGTTLHVKATLTDTAGDTNSGSPTDSTADTTVDAIANLDIANAATNQSDNQITGGDDAHKLFAGNRVIYTVVVTNNGPSDAQEVKVAEAFDSAIDATTAKYCVGNACDPSTGTAYTGGNLSSTDVPGLATLSADDAITIRFTAKVKANVSDSTSISSTASTSSDTNDPTTPNQAAEATTVNTKAVLSLTNDATNESGNPITQTDDAHKLFAGERVVYTVTVTNNGPSDAQGVLVSESFDSHIDATTGKYCVGGGCDPSTGTAYAGGNLSSTNVPGLATVNAGGSITIRFTAKVKANTPNTTTITSTSSTQSSTYGSTTPVTKSTDTVVGTPVANTKANLSVTNTATNQLGNLIDGTDDLHKLYAGNRVIYTVVVTNNGPSDAQNVHVGEALAAALANDAKYCVNAGCNPATGTAYAGGDLTPSDIPALSTLAAGGTITIRFTATVPASFLPNSGSITSTASTGSDTYDPSLPNSAGATSTVNTKADLSVTNVARNQSGNLISGADKLYAGERVIYTVVVTNGGPSDAQNVMVAEALDSALDASTAKYCVGATCDPSTGTAYIGANLTSSDIPGLATLAAGGSITVRFTAKVPASFLPDGGSITSTASTSSATFDPTSPNNAGTTSTINTKADVKQTSATATTPAGNPANTVYANATAANTVTYDFSFKNDGPSDAQNVKVTDTLPSKLIGSGAQYRYCVGTNCTLGSWTPFTPTAQLTITVGTITPGTPFSVEIEAHADSNLGHGANPTGPFTGIQNGAAANSTANGPVPATFDPAAANNGGNAIPNISIFTVPAAPTDPDGRPGSFNAYFLWQQSLTANGGSGIDVFAITVAGPTTPIIPNVNVTDQCGTNGNNNNNSTVFCTQITPLNNPPSSTPYTFSVSAHNAVGLSDAVTSGPVVPSTDASAKQIGGTGGVLTQNTGNGSTSKTDQQITVQTFPSGTTGVGTILEGGALQGTFCSGSCTLGKIVRTKLLDPNLPGTYTITLVYDKTLVGGTGQKYSFFYAASDTAPTGQVLATCPKTITTNSLPCVEIKLGSGGANPALKAIIHTKDPDPTLGGRTYPT